MFNNFREKIVRPFMVWRLKNHPDEIFVAKNGSHLYFLGGDGWMYKISADAETNFKNMSGDEINEVIENALSK